MVTVASIGWIVLLAQAAPVTWSDLAQLGVIALAAFAGAGAVYHFGVLPERKRYEDERAERIQAQAQWREAYELTTPALAQANSNSVMMMELLRRGEGGR